MFLKTVPAGLSDCPVQTHLTIFKGNMADAFLGRTTLRRPEMINQLSSNQWQLATHCVCEKAFSRTVSTNYGPLLIITKNPGRVLKDESITETKRGLV